MEPTPRTRARRAVHVLLAVVIAVAGLSALATPAQAADSDIFTGDVKDGSTIHPADGLEGFEVGFWSESTCSDEPDDFTELVDSYTFGGEAEGLDWVRVGAYINGDFVTSSCIAIGSDSPAEPSLFRERSADFGSSPTVGQAVELNVSSDPVADGHTVEWTVSDDDTAEVLEETGDSYTPKPRDLGKTLSASVTFTKDGYTDATATVEAVVGPEALELERPTITGTPQVGETLKHSTVQAPQGSTVTYTWGAKLPGEDACTSIGVTTASLTLVKSLQGAQVCVTALVKAPGQASTTITSELTEVIVGLSPVVSVPSISDTTPTFGQTLTASVPAYDLPPGATVSYAWGHRSIDADDQPTCDLLDESASAVHTVGLDDLDERLCVVATVTAEGYQDGSSSSRFTAAVVKASMGAVTVGFDDTTPVVGQTLKASVRGEGIPDGATTTYAFGAEGASGSCVTNGAAGATAMRAVDADDLDTKLCVTAVVTAPGREDASATSALTSSVAKGELVGGSVALAGTPKVDVPLSASVTAPSSPAPSGTSYAWTVGGDTVATTSTYTPVAADAGRSLVLKVTWTKAGYLERAVSSVAATVAKGTFTIAAPAVSDTTPLTGSPLTASVPDLGPGAVATYRWGVVPLGSTTCAPGTKTVSYTPTVADLGKAVCVVATVERSGYQDATSYTVLADRVREKRSITLADTSVRRGQKVRLAIHDLVPDRKYRIRIYDRTFTGTAPKNGRVAFTYVYPDGAGTSRRTISVRQDSGTVRLYDQAISLTYTNA